MSGRVLDMATLVSWALVMPVGEAAALLEGGASAGGAGLHAYAGRPSPDERIAPAGPPMPRRIVRRKRGGGR